MYRKLRKRNYNGMAISFSLHEASGSQLPVADKVEKHGENSMFREFSLFVARYNKDCRLSSTFADQAFIIASLEVRFKAIFMVLPHG
jgi:hypothetical protein